MTDSGDRAWGWTGAGALIGGVLTIAAILASPPLSLALDSREIACRKSLGAGTLKLAQVLMREQSKCRFDRMRGRLDSATDCHDLSQMPLKSQEVVEKLAGKLERVATKKCDRKGIRPASLGLYSCAAPCGSHALDTFAGPQGAAACLACRARTGVLASTENLFGNAPAMPELGLCQKAIGLGWAGEALAISKAAQKCQLSVDVGRATSPADGCAAEADDRKIAAAREKTEKRIADMCDDSGLVALDICTGAESPEAIAACISENARGLAAGLFEASYKASPSSAPRSDALDYAHWNWPGNHRPTETWPVIERVMHFTTGYYALAINEATAAISHIGLLHDALSERGSRHRPVSEVTALPGAMLRFEAGPSGSGIEATSFLGSNNSTIDIAKMIDGGRFMNRIEIPTVGYATDPLLSGRVEIASMPRHFVLTQTVRGDSAASMTARIVLGGDFVAGHSFEWLDSGRTLRLLAGDGNGWIFLVREGEGTLSLSSGGDVVAERSDSEPVAEGATISLIVIPTHAVSEDELGIYREPDTAIGIQYTLLSLEGGAVGTSVDATWDSAMGAYLVPLQRLQDAGAPGSANFDEEVYHHWHGRHRIEIDSGGRGPMAVPLALHGSHKLSWYITGGSFLFRDAAGHPNGLPLQVSKNWHGEYWYHLYALPIVSGEAPETLELTVASSRWGEAYAASHAQLSLIGWGEWGGHWDESALGVFGESVTYDKDMTLRRAQQDDVRPFLVQSKDRWNWTGNVGGADFLNYATAAQPYWKRRLARVRSSYDALGPLLTDVTYSGVSSDGRIEAEIRTRLQAASDLLRVYLDFDYRFLDDVEYDRLGFYQVAADNYSDNLFQNIAWGDADALVENRVVPDHQTTGYASEADRGIALEGNSPWVMLYDNQRVGDSLPERYANVGFVVRAFEAEIGGQTFTVPHLNLRRTYNGEMSQIGFELGLPHQSGSLWCGEPCEGKTRFVPANSRVRITLEYLVPPADKGRYYGESGYLLSLPAEDFNSPAMLQMLAGENALSVEVRQGRLRREQPVEIDTVLGAVAADISISGGLGHTPIVFHQLERHDGWTLERLDGESWETVDQSVHGNDFTQVDFDEDAGTWSIVFAVPIEGGGRFRLLRGSAQP